ncbi:hypothetical protein ACT3UM_22485 [Halomonas sp. AOP13-D3-9]
MKIGFSSFTFINQRQDKPQFLTPTRVAPQKSEPAEDDPFTKRLKKQQEALESLASLPTPKEASQQQASDKVGFLRQRIEMLKAMMAFASPEQLKNMAKELKSIARELAGAAKLLNSQGGGGAGMTAIPSVISTSAVASAAAPPAVAQPSGAESAGAQAGGDESAQASVSSDAQQAEANAQTAEDDAEKAAEQEAEKAAGETEGDEATELGVLTDAQKELREAVNMLKIRLNEEDKEARRELKKAEEVMEKTDHAVAASTSDALYSSLGQLLPTSLGEVSVLTPSINIEV